jgi:hypothetical protein
MGLPGLEHCSACVYVLHVYDPRNSRFGPGRSEIEWNRIKSTSHTNEGSNSLRDMGRYISRHHYYPLPLRNYVTMKLHQPISEISFITIRESVKSLAQ